VFTFCTTDRLALEPRNYCRSVIADCLLEFTGCALADLGSQFLWWKKQGAAPLSISLAFTREKCQPFLFVIFV
jgi:hypothetical protein